MKTGDSTGSIYLKKKRRKFFSGFLPGVIVLFFQLPHTVFCQTPLDSLEKILPSLKGNEKIRVAGDLAYQYCFINTDKALKFGELAMRLAQDSGDSMIIAQAWNDLGAVYASRGDFKESIRSTKNALRIRQNRGDSLLVANSLNKIGYAYHGMGELDQALSAFLRAAHIYETEKKVQLLDMLYNNIGSVYLRQGNNAEAVSYLQKAAAVARTNGNNDVIISAELNLANLYFDRKQYDSSSIKYLGLIRMAEKENLSNNLPTLYMNLGACYTRMGRFDEALNYLDKAEKQFRQKNDKKGLSMVLVNKGLSYIGRKEFDKAAEYIGEGKKYGEETGSNYQLLKAYEALSEFERARGDYRKALEYLSTANQYQALIQNEQVNEKVAEMETRYKTRQKEHELAMSNDLLAKEQQINSNQKTIIFLLSIAMLLVLGTIVFVFRNQKLKRESLLQKAMLALQEERLRISRDLHDNIGAELTLISSALEQKALETNGPGDKKELEEISTYARNAMGQLRETIWTIRTEKISLDSFGFRLMDYAARVCKHSGILSSVEISGDRERILSPSQTIHLYRLCQEAIHNAVKYASCTKLEVNISALPGLIRVNITDNGRGFDPSEQGQGYGLKNMRARAEELGGSFSITSNLGEGTRILMELPA